MLLIFSLILIVVFAITGISAKKTISDYAQTKKKNNVVRKAFRPSQLINNIPEKFIGKTTYEVQKDEEIPIIYEDNSYNLEKITDLAKEFSTKYGSENKKELDEQFKFDNRITDYNVRKKIFTLIVLIVLPIVTFHLFVKIKSNFFVGGIKEITASTENQEKLRKHQERLTSNYSTSGRTEIWRNILLIAIEEKIIIGKGPQADRYLLTNYIDKNKKIINFLVYENNASNAILYSYLCAGIFGLFAIIFIYANFIKIIYKNVFVKKNFC